MTINLGPSVAKSEICFGDATSVEDTFREIRDDILNTFVEPGKTVAQTASIILEKANDKVYLLQE